MYVGISDSTALIGPRDLFRAVHIRVQLRCVRFLDDFKGFRGKIIQQGPSGNIQCTISVYNISMNI